MTSPAQMYESFFVPAMFGPWSSELVDRAEVAAGHRALDLACGTGVVARRLAGLGARVTGLDPNAAMLEVAGQRARDEGLEIAWVAGTADATGLPDAGFERATCQQGFQFFGDRPAAARELRRVLAPGGRAVVSCWRPIDEQPAFAALDELERRHSGGGVDVPFSFGDPDEMRALLESAGFDEVTVEIVARTVRFPSPDSFMQLTFTAAAAVVPGYMELSEAEREARIAALVSEAQAVIAPFVEDGHVVFPMRSVVATARVSAP